MLLVALLTSLCLHLEALNIGRSQSVRSQVLADFCGIRRVVVTTTMSKD
jgi:hypothetical protein